MTKDDGILRRRMTPWAARRTYFSKALVWAAQRQTEPTPLSCILDYVASRGYRQILLTGGWDAAHTPEREYWIEPAAVGWAIERYVPDPRSCVYYRERSGDRITVRMSAAWYDACDDTALIEDAHSRLEHLLKAAFDKGAILFGTPSRTGEDLLLRSLPERKQARAFGRDERAPYEYFPAPVEVRDILEHNFGQGRMQFLAPEGAPPLRNVWLLDARWMYAAHCRNLPVMLYGYRDLICDDAPDFERYRPGFYRVDFRAPPDWEHIGLLPAWDSDAGRTSWPVVRHWASGWVTEPELRLALEHAWEVRIRERILFNPESTPGADPARRWIETLVKLRAEVEQMAGPKLGALLSAALRNIQIGAVGGWKRASRRELHVTLPGHDREIPDDADDVTPIYANPKKPTAETLRRIEWYSRGQLDSMQTAMYRPEWSVAVWGGARTVLAKEALAYPLDWELALRSDAIALRQLPGDEWLPRDDGKPGRFRLKREWHFETPQPAPRDETSWRTLTGGEE